MNRPVMVGLVIGSFVGVAFGALTGGTEVPRGLAFALGVSFASLVLLVSERRPR